MHSVKRLWADSKQQLYQPSGALWLFSVFFTDSVNGWVVGAGGSSSLPGEILQTTNGGVTFIENESRIEVTQFKLYHNYPNPFNPSTKIKYQITNLSFVSLKVFDVLGKEVATLVNEEKPAGRYEVEFSTNKLQLTSGIYFYTLSAGSFNETKKMILLR